MERSQSTRDIAADIVEQARTLTRNELGSAVEEKATNEFCVNFGSAVTGSVVAGVAAGSLFAESTGLPAPDLSAIVEFAPEPPPGDELPPELSPELAASARESLEALFGPSVASEADLSTLVRQARIRTTRDAFFQRAGLIRDEVERATSDVARALTGGRHLPDTERLLVEVCWLNQTIRTADARSLTSIAADPRIERVDVPRPLFPDAIDVDVVLDALPRERERHGLTGRGVSLAVIDSEVALGHPALLDRVIHRRNYTREPWGIAGDHGTAVAGIIAAASDEYTGIAPEATIYNYKVLATHRLFGTTDFQGARAIEHALEDGASVANCSWGAGPVRDGSSREARACDEAWRLGMTVVKSAGNIRPESPTLTTPGDAEGVIVVGATNEEGTAVADYSCRGPLEDGRQRPHLVAPSGNVGLLPAGGVGRIGSGTSFAAPHVAALLALLLEAQPDLSPEAQRQRILKACQPLGGFAENEQGAGLVTPALLFE